MGRTRVGFSFFTATLGLILCACTKLSRPTPPIEATSDIKTSSALTQTKSSFYNPTYIAKMETLRPLPPPTCCPPTEPPPPFPTGIYEAHMAPQPFVNVWQGIVNGQRVSVYAGGSPDTYSDKPNLTAGVLRVRVVSADLSNYENMEYKTTDQTGWLLIKVEKNYVLTLTGQNGQTLYFDVLTMQFVDSPSFTRTAPTITPLPPASATPTSHPIPAYPYPIR